LCRSKITKQRKQTASDGITFVWEMDEDELRKAGEKEAIIDSIEMAECETQEEVQTWLQKTAPAAFLRG
jgi:hypothetical protein